MQFVNFMMAVSPVLMLDEPYPVTIAGALAALTDLGLLPVITVAAVLFLAVVIYKRFRK